MLRITLEGPDAENFIEWRKRNSELAKENLALKGEIAFLKKKLQNVAKPRIGLVVDRDGNLLDVKEG